MQIVHNDIIIPNLPILNQAFWEEFKKINKLTLDKYGIIFEITDGNYIVFNQIRINAEFQKTTNIFKFNNYFDFHEQEAILKTIEYIAFNNKRFMI